MKIKRRARPRQRLSGLDWCLRVVSAGHPDHGQVFAYPTQAAAMHDARRLVQTDHATVALYRLQVVLS